LGTTNIKVAIFDDQLQNIGLESENVTYLRNNDFIEFDAEAYFATVISTIQRCYQKNSIPSSHPIHQIVLTGQAESLVAIDECGNPVRNAISWLDMRSREECEELKRTFNPETCYQITGQPEIIPTWPITKILWLRRHEPNIYKQVSKYLLLKDYIQFKLTGKIVGEFSIYNFSHYFNITRKEYWWEILEYCGISQGQLPPLVEPCTVLGQLKTEIALEVGISPGAMVNVGTLDHFAGMVGTGNIREGIISESTGTVLSIATMVFKPVFGDVHVPLHYGPFKDTYVFLPVCESGGISLEWFKNNFLPNSSYGQIDEESSKKSIPNELIFLPYITGVNAPDFNPDATGIFYGIQTKHDPFDFALAIMEGVSHLLKKNMDYIEKAGFRTEMIISTGGGAKSAIWSQMKADITQHTVAIPQNEEAACLGAAMIGAVSEGIFPSYEEAVAQCVKIKKTYLPQPAGKYLKKHALFNLMFEQALPVFQFARR
jgi:sugar (pentulose or hexulose) kinase